MVKKKSKNNKVESIDESFDFSSVAGAKRNISSNITTKNVKKKLARFKMYLTDDYYYKYNKIYLEYAHNKQIFNLTNDRFFKSGVMFLQSKFSNDNMYKNRPDDFHNSVTRPGKRKRHDRYVSSKDGKCVNFIVDENISDDYTSIMYSYILKNDKASLYDQKHSRGYFFFDFIDLLIENKKAFFKFSLD